MLLEQEPRPLLQTLRPQQPAPLPISGHTRKPNHHQQQHLLAAQLSSIQQAAAVQQLETASHEPRPSNGPQTGFDPLPLPYDQQSRGTNYILGLQLQSAEHGHSDDGLPDTERQELSTPPGSSSQWERVVDPAMYHDSTMNAEVTAVQARSEEQQADVREPATGFQHGGIDHWQGSVHPSVDSSHAPVDAVHQGRGSKRQAPAYETAATAEADSSSGQVDLSSHQLPHVAVGTRQANDVDSQMQSPSSALSSLRRRLMSVEPEIDRSQTGIDVLNQLINTGHGMTEAQLGSVRQPTLPGSNAQDPLLSSLGVPWGEGIMHDQGHAVEWQTCVDGQSVSRHQVDLPPRTLHPSQAGTSSDQGPSGWDPSQQDPSNGLGSVPTEGAAHASSDPAQAYGQGDHETNSISLQTLGGNADGSSWDPQQAVQQRYVARDRDGSDLTWVRRFPDAAWRSITPATDASAVAPDLDSVHTTTVRVVNMRVSMSC